MRDPRLIELLARRNRPTEVAQAFGISVAAVSQWKVVPARRAARFAQIVGVPVDEVPIPAVDREAMDMATVLAQEHWNALSEPQRDAVAACHALSFTKRQADTVRRAYGLHHPQNERNQ